jgi:aspartyl-tRNA(Asn)/glutamyl-tRNA(Gln) amidotransferase subunit C
MQIGYHKKAIEFFLHFYIIPNGAEVIAQVQKTSWANATHYDLSFLFHKILLSVGEDRKSCQSSVCNRQSFPLINPICRLATGNCKLPVIGYICSMEVNEALVDKLANLARLKFDVSEKEAIKNDLQKMILFVEKLNELDTDGVEPLLHMSGNVNVLRADVVQGSITREAGLQNAAVYDEHFFKVPKVIKK